MTVFTFYRHRVTFCMTRSAVLAVVKADRYYAVLSKKAVLRAAAVCLFVPLSVCPYLRLIPEEGNVVKSSNFVKELFLTDV